MIVGADGANDAEIVATSATLYASYDLKRVYYSAFSPIPDASRAAAAQGRRRCSASTGSTRPTGSMRFYGFARGEIADGMTGGMLDLDIDPKLAWALRNRARFPVDVNTAAREELSERFFLLWLPSNAGLTRPLIENITGTGRERCPDGQTIRGRAGGPVCPESRAGSRLPQPDRGAPRCRGLPPLSALQERDAGGVRRGPARCGLVRRRAAGRSGGPAGKPFVGPAGRVLDEALEEAASPRRALRHECGEALQVGARGKRRIHQKPTLREVKACRPWLETELAGG